MIELFRYIEQSFVPATDDDNSISVESDTDFQNQLRSNRHDDGSTKRMREEANQQVTTYLARAESAPRVIQLGRKLLEFKQVVEHSKSASAANIHRSIEKVFEQTAQDLVGSDHFVKDKDFLNDSIVAVKLVTAFDRVDSSALVAMRQAIALIEDAAQDQLKDADSDTIKRRLQRPIRVPESLLPLRSTNTVPTFGTGEQDPEHKKIEALQQEANALKTTYQTLMSVYPEDLEITEIEREPAPRLLANIEAVSVQAAQNDQADTIASASAKTVLALSQSLLSKLPDEVRKTFDSLGVNPATTALPNLVSRVKDRWLAATQELQPYIMPAPAKIYQLGIHTFAMQPLAKVAAQPIEMPDFSHAVTRPVGIGNLQVVRQELIGYEAGEISHIENILEGELYRRSTTRTESTDITVIQERETIRVDERDLQSTDRNELASEAQREASKQTIATEGNSTTTDYGKLVENNKTNFARSVTDRAVNSLTQKVREQRITREQRSYTEKTVHEFDNRSQPAKVRGIYQWVDKKFKTRIMNYGKRLLYDVVIPEPAAFLIESLKNAQQPEAFDLTKPKPPSLLERKLSTIKVRPLGEGGPIVSWTWETRDLLPEDLNTSNYKSYAKQYGVTGAIEPPPDEFVKTFARVESPIPEVTSREFRYHGKAVGTEYFAAFNIDVPDDYKAVSGYIQRVYPQWDGDITIDNEGETQYAITIGEHYAFTFGKDFITDLIVPFKMHHETGNLPVTVRSYRHFFQLSYAIGINCQRTDKVYEKWQLKTFAAITEGYRRQIAEYEDKLAQRQTALRTQMALMRNYAHNPSIEQTELKKAFIHLLMSEHFTNVNYPTPNPNQFPGDPTYVKQWGAVVAFFERAFEWENIIYHYYPYFWGQRSRWGELVLIQDLDPHFEEFLKAGAARVVIPVRPGFEGALAHYHETGDVWMGEEIPNMYSDFYVSIIDEIKSRNYSLDKEICVAEWEVKLPTTLVMLKEDATLPEWESKVKCIPVDE